MVIKITKNEFDKVLKEKKAIVIFGYPDNTIYKRIINSLKDSNTGNNDKTVFTIEFESDDVYLKEFNITVYPCSPVIVAYENGEEKGRISDITVMEIVLDMYMKGEIS